MKTITLIIMYTLALDFIQCFDCPQPDGFFSDPTDPHYYNCGSGKPYRVRCIANLVFNTDNQECDYYTAMLPTTISTTTITTTTTPPTTPSTPITTDSCTTEKSELEKKVKEIEQNIELIIQQTLKALDENNAQKIAAFKIKINEELKIVETTETTVTELAKTHTTLLDKFFLESQAKTLSLAKSYLNQL